MADSTTQPTPAPQPTHMAVSEYAKLIGEQPQLVHYYIRSGQIDKAPCECCGRSVINVKQANEVFDKVRTKREL